MKKKRVLFVGSFKNSAKDGSVGGQMFACQSLIKSNLSNHIDWILLDSTADSNILPSFYNRSWKALKRILRFINYIIFSRVDRALIFTADGFSFIEKGLMVCICRLFGIRSILAPRSGIVVMDLENSAFMRKYIPFVLRKADIVVCQGQSWKSFYCNLIAEQEIKFIIVQNWIDINNYQTNLTTRHSGNINVLFMSWVDRKKGILDLINAAALLKDNYSNVTYHIGGNGMAMDESKALVKERGVEGQFVFHGWIRGTEKEDLLALANVYVLPSYFEGFPNSLMEAMTCGPTVISSKVGSVPDLIRDEVNGLLFEAGNVGALSQKLKSVFDSPELRIRLSKNARNTILENNTIKIAVEKFKNILE